MTAQEAEGLRAKQKLTFLTLPMFGLIALREVALNQKNYFAEVGQVAFNPSHLVPGIEPSSDLVLQGRLFSDPNAHRHRIGANYQQLPVNASKTAHHQANFQRDGDMASYNQGSRHNYFPSIEPTRFRNRSVDLGKLKSQFADQAVSFHFAIRPEDFNNPCAL